MEKEHVLIIGAGIVGLAIARAEAVKGNRVTVIDRHERSVGASIRNFGMIWPIGQPSGKLYARAMRSREIWKSICDEAGIWYDPVGSLHLAYEDDELQAMSDFVEVNKQERLCSLLTPAEVIKKSPGVNLKGLKGALWSPDEMIVEARVAIDAVAGFLEKRYDVTFVRGTAVSHISFPEVWAGRRSWSADRVYVCSGVDFETLYPEVFQETSITKCKLQMLRTAPQPEKWRIGPALCGSLSLIHYNGFRSAASLPQLKERFEREYAELLKLGIHVMVSQNEQGELTIGDSHEYGPVHDPFIRSEINDLILNYFKTFTNTPHLSISQHWIGIYPKMTNGDTEFVHTPESGVLIVNGLGGAGMTLSFGLAEEIVNNK